MSLEWLGIEFLDTLADMILIAQVLYYKRYPYRKRRPSSHSPGPSHLSPATPLLNPNKPPKRPPPISTAKAGKILSVEAKSSINQFFCCSRSCSVRNLGLLLIPSIWSICPEWFSRRHRNRDFNPRTDLWVGMCCSLPWLSNSSSRQEFSKKIYRRIKPSILPICMFGEYYICPQHCIIKSGFTVLVD